jgi:predicted DCC family thiol-disulfide oxidoreductase YuxK
VLRLDRHRVLQPLALQTDEAKQMLGAMSEDQRMASWHLVSPSGDVESAGLALAPLLRLLPGWRPFAAVAERMPAAMSRFYAWVAGHRSDFGPLVTDGAKARADRLIAARAAREQNGVS